VLLLVPLLTFLLLSRAPGDFLSELAADPRLAPTTLAQLRAEYGLDQAYYHQYGRWLGGLLSGELGYSFVYQRPVAELIAPRIGRTVLLNALALALAWLLGLALGLGSGVVRHPAARWLNGALATLLISTPPVLLALLLMAVAAPLGLPTGGMTTPGRDTADFGDVARHLALPVIAVAVVWLPVVMRHTAASVGQTMTAPFIRTAQAKGISRWRILFRHALPNAWNPLATLFGFSVSSLLSASLLVEVVMSWPGMGQLMVDAVLRRDLYLVVDLAVLAAFLLLAGNLIGDFLLYFSDPRTEPE
jgi:peptide/nickel transport system permease protein